MFAGITAEMSYPAKWGTGLSCLRGVEDSQAA
jgi:hypothetical protein